MIRALLRRLRFNPFAPDTPPAPGPLVLERRRVFILPTRYGLLFAVLLLVMLLGSINYNNNLGFVLTFLLGALALVSILHGYRNLVRLTLRAVRTDAVFAGQKARYTLAVDNRDGPPRYAVTLALRGQASQEVIDVPAAASVTVTLARPAPRRGVWPMGPLTVSSRFPLGLFRAWAPLQLDLNALVYPRPGPRRPAPLAAHYRLSAAGDRGYGTEDFVGLRRYHPGDSPRHVSWKAAARGLGLLTKQFGGDRAEELWLDWDRLQGLDTETRLSQMCRWVLDADEAQRRYGLHLPGLTLAPEHGARHRQRCLEALARFEARP
ncbi:MAG: DUF58 domain-containing protein [Gammaproteobacteria bacterium]|nr:DUF58 domain-containing protein [Gammaproteobacteria bacterium]